MTPAQPLTTRALETIEARSIEWLDKPFLQGSAFHLAAGPKGVGKSTWLVRIIAAITTGKYGAPQNVLLVSSEDSAAIDIRPRLTAAKGDASRVHLITSEFLLPRDVENLKALALELGDVGLIIIDPVGNHLSGADTDKEGAVRNAIHGLNKLADDLGCVIVGVRHLTKVRLNGALASILGSVAWVDLPRAVIVFAPDDEDDMTFHAQVVAGNRSGRGAAQGYRIELVDVGLAEPVTYAAELGDSGKSVDQLLATTAAPSRGAKRASVKDLILRELAKGPQSMEHLKACAIAEQDASGETTWRAAHALKAEGQVGCSNSGPGTPWLWELREAPDEVRTPIPELDTRNAGDEVRSPETAQPSQMALTSSVTTKEEVRRGEEDTNSLTSSTPVYDEVRGSKREADWDEIPF